MWGPCAQYISLLLLPFACLGGLFGRRLGDRLDENAFAVLAVGLLLAAGSYTLVSAALR